MTNGIGGFKFNQNHTLKLKPDSKENKPQLDSEKNLNYEKELNLRNQPKLNFETQDNQGKKFLG